MFVKLKVGDYIVDRDNSFRGEIMSIKGNTAKVSVVYPEELTGIIKECHVSELKQVGFGKVVSSVNDYEEPDTFREQEAVSEFHKAFNYPQADKPTPLTKEQAFKRAVFILEEVIEFIASSVDTPEEMVELVNELTQSHAVEAMNKEMTKMGERGEEYDEVDKIVDQSDALVDILYFAFGSGDQMSVDLLPLFKIAHESNMSKLDDDGNPIYNEFGKISKSSNFIEPAPRQREEVIKQIERVDFFE